MALIPHRRGSLQDEAPRTFPFSKGRVKGCSTLSGSDPGPVEVNGHLSIDFSGPWIKSSMRLSDNGNFLVNFLVIGPILL